MGIKKASHIGLLVFFLMVLSTLSCENGLLLNVDCDECYLDEPNEAEITIYLTENGGRQVIVNVYQGKFETDNIWTSDTIETEIETFYVWVETGKQYSVTAQYDLGDEIITALDGNEVRTNLVSESCGEPCYIVTGNVFNVELKY